MKQAVRPFSVLTGAATCLLTTLLMVGCGDGDNSVNQSPTAPTPVSGPSTSPGLLSGKFVYSTIGTSPVDGDFQVAGQFVADGKGNITSAVADYNLGGGVDPAVQMYGTYTVSGSTVTVLLTDGNSTSEAYSIAFTSSGNPTITNLDGTGTGTLYTQNTTGTTLGGTYTYNLAGEGEGTVTATGNFTTAANGIFSGGSATYTDGNSTLTNPANTGFIGVAQSNGRGLASIDGNNFSYYIVAPNQLLFIGRDDRVTLHGFVTKS